jgi:hypothetical protein
MKVEKLVFIHTYIYVGIFLKILAIYFLYFSGKKKTVYIYIYTHKETIGIGGGIVG